MSKEFPIFPWDAGEKPYFVNEEGTEFYIDEATTDWARREDPHGTKLDAVCFYVRKDGICITRILMDVETNAILADYTNLEDMAVKIDTLKAWKRFDTKQS